MMADKHPNLWQPNQRGKMMQNQPATSKWFPSMKARYAKIKSTRINKKTAGYILLVNPNNPSNTSMFLEVFASATTFIRSKWSAGISSPPEDVALMYPSCNWTSHFPRQCTAIWAATAAWARRVSVFVIEELGVGAIVVELFGLWRPFWMVLRN